MTVPATPETRAAFEAGVEAGRHDSRISTLLELVDDVACGNTEYDVLSAKAARVLADMPERSLDDDFEDAKLALRELHSRIDPDDAGESEMQITLMTCLDNFDECVNIHEREKGE